MSSDTVHTFHFTILQICRLAFAVATDHDTLKYEDASEWCQSTGWGMAARDPVDLWI